MSYMAGVQQGKFEEEHPLLRRPRCGGNWANTVPTLPHLLWLVPALQPRGFVRGLPEVLISGIEYETEEVFS